MSQQAATSPRKKQLTAAGLALLLIIALLWPAEGEPPAAEVPATEQPRARTARAASPEPPRREAVELPRMTLEEIIACDPFARRAGAAESEADVASSESTPAEPVAADAPRPRVRAVYGGNRGSAALVERRIVHEGDELPGGRRVEAILPQGITIRTAAGG